jgi:hypothetical protein
MGLDCRSSKPLMETFTPPIATLAEEQYHAPMDYLQSTNRRKTVAIFLMGITIAGLIAAVVTLALRPPIVMVTAIAPDGEEYIISEPKKKLDLRDEIIYKPVVQELMSFSEAYFERSPVTAQKDYNRARWFLPDSMLRVYDATALGPKGWLAQLQNRTTPESHARIDSIELRSADILKEPYQARVYLTRISSTGQVQHTIATLTFVVRPDLIAKVSRVPLYNALGVLIVNPIEEHADFRQ